MPPKLLVIVGPTASGKTRMAVELAKQLDGEVVSADSMQIYRRMDIGTAKPTKEEMQGIPHHMIDVVEPDEAFSVARYVEMASQCVDDIVSRDKTPILAGGTGLYIDSLCSGRTFASFSQESGLREQLEQELSEVGGAAMLERLKKVDPESGARLHANDHKRIIRALEVYESTGKTLTQHNLDTQKIPPRYDALTVGLAFQERAHMWGRIDQRVDEMVAAGLEQEVYNLLNAGIPQNCTAMQAIGYKEFVEVAEQGGNREKAIEMVKLRSRQYAKRQLTWFRKNTNTKWILWDENPNILQAIQSSTSFAHAFGL